VLELNLTMTVALLSDDDCRGAIRIHVVMTGGLTTLPKEVNGTQHGLDLFMIRVGGSQNNVFQGIKEFTSGYCTRYFFFTSSGNTSNDRLLNSSLHSICAKKEPWP
jgi:hypothetical protein